MSSTSKVGPLVLCLLVPILGCGDDADGGGGGGGDTTTTTTTAGTTSGVPTTSSTTSTTSTAGDGGSGGGVNPPVCGDGAVEGSEGCDDGNTTADDGCDATCGVEDGWTCVGDPSVCTPVCGDGSLVGDEGCDDGNGDADDGCDATCAIEPGWMCDGEPSVCSEVCGDGVVTLSEECDDAGTAPGDGCDDTCAVEVGYACNGEPSVCSVECGDGNTAVGDGCDAACTIEAGYICSGEPSVCTNVVGDTCAAPAVLTTGMNTVVWTATGQEYITTVPACGVSYAPTGPDVVMEYTAAVSGELDFSIVKPADTRWHMLINDDACGTTTPALLCVSDWAPTSLTGTFPVTAGQTYYFYIVDSTSGALPLSNPLEMTINVTPETCGDGIIIGNETCEDGNTAAGDGCSAACQIEPGYTCSGLPSTCVLAVAENCSSSFALSAGPNTVAWIANLQDYFTSPPSCNTTALAGPDLVMHYTATVTGELDFSIAKPTSQRWHLLVNDDTCGTTTPALACVSDSAGAALAGTIAVTAGTTYYFYLVDTTSGAQPLSNPLQVTMTETAELCGDGIVTGNETCDDGNTTGGDGCSDTCQTEAGYTCLGEPSICVLPMGEDCSDAAVLSAGANTVIWTASQQDYFTSPPSCSTQALAGPDVVMQYTATVSGPLEFSIGKPTSQRWHVLVNDATCGTTTPALACVSDFTNPALAGTITATAGTTYYFYLVDTTSGSQPLSNPLEVTIVEDVCGDGFLIGGEACDDGNTAVGDGCSACGIEPGFVCQGEPSVCFIPSCAPGTNGMISGTVTTLATDLPTALTEGYIAVDSSPTGWIYVGGTTALHRVPKAGGPNQNVKTLAGLADSNLGYAMLIDGPDIYTVEGKATDTTGHIWRISTDGGVSWAPTDYATLPAVPNDWLQAVVAYDGQLYALTNESTTTIATQLFTMPLAGAPPVSATVDLTFVGEGRCAGLALDDDFLYTACGTGERLVRVDRVTGAVTLLSTAFNLDLNANSVFADDIDADGAADVLYFKGAEKRIGYVCDPGGANPYVAELTTYGSTSSTSTLGMAFDSSTNTLYAFDDATEQIVIIQ